MIVVWVLIGFAVVVASMVGMLAVSVALAPWRRCRRVWRQAEAMTRGAARARERRGL